MYARVPLDEPVHLRHALPVARLDAAHQTHGVEARVQARQDRCTPLRSMTRGAQALRHGDDALEIEVGLVRGRGPSRGPCGVLHARTQCQLQAKAVAAQIGCQRAVSVHARTGHERGPYPSRAAHAFLDGATVVSAGEGGPCTPESRRCPRPAAASRRAARHSRAAGPPAVSRSSARQSRTSRPRVHPCVGAASGSTAASQCPALACRTCRPESSRSRRSRSCLARASRRSCARCRWYMFTGYPSCHPGNWGARCIT